MNRLVFLKLGGSLITNKNVAHQAETGYIRKLGDEIHSILHANPELQLLLGHGSGSFGHVPARQYHTREGVHTLEEWKGFAQVWNEARALDQVVIEQLAAARLPIVSFPPSATVTAMDGRVKHWDISPIHSALDHGLVPIIQGDAIFDEIRGGTILSTEELFIYLAGLLQPSLILIAGSEPGVWADFPQRTRLLAEITPDGYAEIAQKVFPSSAVDVTGGMASKVRVMVELVAAQPELQVLIFNPSVPGILTDAFAGKAAGTLIHNQK